VRLDQEGDPGSTAGLLARFGGTRSWFESELSFLDEVSVLDDADGRELAEQAGSVRLYPDILPGDVAKSFRRDVLDDRGLRLDFERAFAAAREGSPLLAPGVAESFPQRLEARPAVSGYRLE
jgi:hypothetical protein